jgi:tRNA pseudouridine38-40 synthase
MPRYFIEVSYRGTRYSGFQVQPNAVSIQAVIEEFLAVIHRREIKLTGSSRTDAGVHAVSNFFHFDTESVHEQFLYKMNSVLPADIAIKNVWQMPEDAHCRFDATSRLYKYRIHRKKDPFAEGASYFYPYHINISLVQEAAAFIKEQEYFRAFSKTNTQVKNFRCNIYRSEWGIDGEGYYYIIEGNRFLRGMVRLITASLLLVGREKLSISAFRDLFSGEKNCGFSVPAHGLYLMEVKYPENYFAV